MSWQPIKSAPRDGTPILVFVPPTYDWDKGYCAVAEWDDGDWAAAECRGAEVFGWITPTGPTHWMPLPSPPDLTPATGDPERL